MRTEQGGGSASSPLAVEAPSREIRPARRARTLVAAVPGIDQLALAGILGVAAGLRLWQFSNLGFNGDEAVYSGQGAALGGDRELSEFFAIFRAHPLLFQTVLAAIFKFGVSDISARMVAIAAGLATVYLVYRIGLELYGRKVGLWAALFLALMPYHVMVSRQALLDAPMTLFATSALLLLGRFAARGEPRWLYAAGGMLGLAFLTKEGAVVLVGSTFAFLALSPKVRVRGRDIGIAAALLLVVISAYPVALALGGGTETARRYLIWQVFRRPNHDWGFYLSVVAPSIGIPLLAAAAFGLWRLRLFRGWRETLLVWWIVVPFAFFQVWPVKGFPYLTVITPPVALLAARAVALWRPLEVVGGRAKPARVSPTAAILVAAAVLLGTWAATRGRGAAGFLAGAGGVPGGRETGVWIRDSVPEGARILTIGPSMANIVQFYGRRKAFGLSVSPNPLRRNPAYEPVRNPDLAIRRGEIHYLVWDAFSARRSPRFASALLGYVRRYHGKALHAEGMVSTGGSEERVAQPAVIVYQVRP